MEEVLANERAAEQHALTLVKNKDQPIADTLSAFNEYRQCALAATFADFAHAEEHQVRLWQAHTDGRRYFRKPLSELRKQGAGRAVEARQLAKLYKEWIKASTRFYREYVLQLSTTFGGIPELEAVAHKVKSDHAGESSRVLLSPEEHKLVLTACHQVLIYLGDLARYRATDQLDSKQEWGPAIGFYDLAHTLLPTSGHGQHQQAVVALERRAHLAALYHLYRSVLADDPHPAAVNNLKLEFGKVNAAWDKQELIPKLAPNDPEAPKHNLTGWFVRMHSVCAKGEVFSSHAELEREVLSQFSAIIRKDSNIFESTVIRMVMINLAAQYHAGLLFQEKQGNNSDKEQQAFFYYFRLNIKTYTVLLQAFHDNVQALPKVVAEDDELSLKLTPSTRRLLPVLRLYSSWLTCNLHLVAGLGADAFLGDSIDNLWTTYARAVDVLANEDIFGIWALDEYGTAYMFEEDVDTIAFSPLQNSQQTVWRNWKVGSDALKPKFSDAGVERMPQDEEMLARVKGLLEDGSKLAHEVEEAPIGIVGDRIYYGQALTAAIAAAEEAKNRPPDPPRPKPVQKPLSYAAAAKSGRSVTKPTANGVSNADNRARQAQVTRMVDNLVDDEEDNNPVTPPQQHIAHPAVVTNGDVPYSVGPYAAHADFANVTSYQPKARSPAIMLPPQPNLVPTPPQPRTPKASLTANSTERMQSVSRLWNDSMASPTSTFPSGLPTGTLASPADIHARYPPRGHSRVNSVNSVRSRTSQGMADPWSTLEYGQTSHGEGAVQPVNGYTNFSASGVTSPLLFGAGGGIWSTGQDGNGPRNTSPNSGHGG
ncbi:hypothetical protein LTR86_000906 [Recurvomyces mirabilis]|nr:hypothetical protein LTR86_000906 [Recurvomyces mirabilis]